MGVIRHVDAGYDRAAEVADASAACASRCGGVMTAGPVGRRCGGDRRPIGRTRRAAATRGTRWTAAELDAARVVRRAGRGGAAWTSRPTATATSGPGGATRGAGRGGHRQPPRLGAGRRRVRRPARRGVRARSRSTCCGPAGSRPAPAARRSSCSPRRRAAGSACPASARRLLTGALDPAAALALTDRDGVTLADAMAPPGSTRRGSGRTPSALARIGAFVELHVEQGRGLVDLDAPVGVASAIWPHGRWRFRLHRRGQPRRHHRRWPTATTRCCRLRATGARRPPRPRPATARAPPSAGCVPNPGGTNVIAVRGGRLAGRPRPTTTPHTRRAGRREITAAAGRRPADEGCDGHGRPRSPR